MNQYWYQMAAAAFVLLLLWMADLFLFQKHKAPEKTGWRLDLFLFLYAWLTLFLLNNHEFVVYNNYSYLSDALLKGRLDTPDLPGYLESFSLGGKTYMHFAPGVAILLLPAAAIFGAQSINYAYVGMTLGALSTVLFYRILQNLSIGKDARERFWCTVLVLFGTVHCFCASIAHSWFIGHAASWMLLFLSLFLVSVPYRKAENESAGFFAAGVAFGLCVCCRLGNLLGAGVFVAYILLKKREGWLRCGLLFAAGAAVFGGLYMSMNYARFGTVMDRSYDLTHLKDLFKPLYYYMQESISESREQMAFLDAVQKTDWDTAFSSLETKRAFVEFLQRNAAESWNYCRGIPETPAASMDALELQNVFYEIVHTSFPKVGGALSILNAKNNLYSIFLLMPEFKAESPFVIPTLAGVSLTFCTPLMYAACIPLYTRRKDPMTWVLLGTTVLTAIPFVMNYGNGFAQFGMRYAMDFLPYIMLLACMGLTEGRWRSYKTALVLVCVLINVWGPIYWNCFYLR